MSSAIRHMVNGQPADSVSILDRGFRYGDGCFETMAVHSGQIRLWDRHYKRFANSCDRLKIKPDFERSVLENEIRTLIGEEENAVVRLTITRGQGGTGYPFEPEQKPTRIISLLPPRESPQKYKENGVDVCICKTRLSRNPLLAGLKHLNRLEQVLARSEWSDEFAEGLLCDDTGNIVEGTITNLFIVENNSLFTPELVNCGVAGVMRAEVLSRASGLGISINEVAIDQTRLLSSNECFLTNAIIGIWPIKTINDQSIKVGSVTRMLQKEMDRIIVNQ